MPKEIPAADGDGLAAGSIDFERGPGRVALLKPRHAQKVQGFPVVGVRGQDGAVGGLGLGHVALAVAVGHGGDMGVDVFHGCPTVGRQRPFPQAIGLG